MDQSLSVICSHCWGNPHTFMNADEIVIHIIQADRVSVVFNLLAEPVRQFLVNRRMLIRIAAQKGIVWSGAAS
jgi:hypothetical protein